MLLYDIINVMKRRLFIAVSLPDDALNLVENELNALTPRFPNSIRFIPRENWHTTLLFLGDQDESEIARIREAMDEVFREFGWEQISFDSILYGPTHHTPRMLWWNATESTSKNLGVVRDLLARALEKRGVQWEHENRPYHGHVTLARLDEPPQDTTLFVSVPASSNEYSVGLFASELSPDGARYSLLYSLEK